MVPDAGVEKIEASAAREMKRIVEIFLFYGSFFFFLFSDDGRLHYLDITTDLIFS